MHISRLYTWKGKKWYCIWAYQTIATKYMSGFSELCIRACIQLIYTDWIGFWSGNIFLVNETCTRVYYNALIKSAPAHPVNDSIEKGLTIEVLNIQFVTLCGSLVNMPTMQLSPCKEWFDTHNIVLYLLPTQSESKSVWWATKYAGTTVHIQANETNQKRETR